MPGMDGYELAVMLRHRFKDEIVLIAVTGSSHFEARVRDALVLVDHYFLKPLSTDSLRKILPPLNRAGAWRQAAA